jgi:tRNA-dihydrouridine synthase C
MKQWLAMLTRSYPEAVLLFAELRREDDCQRISRLLGVEVQAFEECVA